MSVKNTNSDLMKLLYSLEEEHADLNKLLSDAESMSDFDEVTLHRLKKQKLLLKDKIAIIKSQIHPDIIA